MDFSLHFSTLLITLALLNIQEPHSMIRSYFSKSLKSSPLAKSIFTLGYLSLSIFGILTVPISSSIGG